ncbi:MAG: urea transporter [Verrucomicrobia bacterium]|nr:urea transporter [Verrucomicrobiota bacterium]
MIPLRQEIHVGEAGPGFWRVLCEAVPRTYAIVFYSADARFGWAMLALSLCLPWVALAGVAGVALALAAGWWIGVDRGWLRGGFALFNPLLACSAVVLTGRASGWDTGVIVLLWAAAALLTLALTVGLQGWVASRIGLSVQSVPAVIVVALLGWCGGVSGGQGLPVAEVYLLGGSLEALPDCLRAFFTAFGAMVFQPNETVGLLVYAALVLSSPLGALTATVGFAAGAAVMHVLGWPVTALGTAWCGFNFLLAGVALGAGYQVPNRTSLVLAAFGGGLVAVAAVGLSVGMGRLGLAPGALPYNLVVLGVMAGLRWLPQPRGLLRSPWTTLQPEATARVMQINALRFTDFLKPALFLPWTGTRVVTQGFDGDLTHRGAWRHGLDFEAPGGAGSWDAGSGDLREFAVFGTPVYSPVDGTVVAVENTVADNPVGTNNPEQNWGNHVIVRSDLGHHVMLAHFQQGSIVVAAHQRVAAGMLLGSCGNSGRSPVPHLHVHVQESAFRGAATLPFVLKHFIAPDPETGREHYHLSGVPGQGALLRPTRPAAEIHAGIAGWLPGEMVFVDDHGREERVVLDFDESGRFRFESPRRMERLTAFLAEGVLYASPFTGRAGGALGWLGILLARIPCMDEPGVAWDDKVAAAPFFGPARRALHDLCDPFAGPEVLHYEYTLLERDGDTAEIVARLAPGDLKRAQAAPRLIRGKLRGREGVVEVSGETCGGEKFRISREIGK